MKKKLFQAFAVVFMALFCVQVLPAAECLLNLPLNEGPGVKIKDVSSFTNSLRLEGDKWQEIAPAKYARKFEGQGNAIRLFTDKLFPDQFTVSFWILPKASGEREPTQYLCSSAGNEGGGWRAGYSLTVNPKAGIYELQLVIRLEGQTWFGPIGLVAPDKFSYVSVTYDRTNIFGYVNGERVFEKTETRAITYASNNQAMTIGTPARGKTAQFYGLLKDFRFYKGALAPEEIKAMYKESVGAMAYQEKTTEKNARYYTDDKLFGPDYGTCRNLLQNPSFEAGGRYWSGVNNGELFFGKYFEIDSSESFGGNKSIVLYSYKGYREITRVTSFNIPVQPGEKYTLSFYCRGDKAISLDAMIYTGVWADFPAHKSFPVTKDWTRHSLTFTAPNAIAAPTFYAQGFPAEDGRVWIDAVQLEAGEKPTEFTEKPIVADLVTDHYDNLCQPGEAVNGRLEIYTAKSGISGEVDLTIGDYSGKKLNARKCSFKTNAKGTASIRLDELDGLPCGLYKIRAEFELSDDSYSDYDFFRFGVMRYLDNKHKLKDFFSSYPGTFPSPSKSFERYRHIGLGSCKFVNFPSTEIINLYQKNNISLMPYLAYKAKASYALDGAEGYKNPNISEDVARNKCAVHMVGAEQYETIAEVCRRVAKAHPEFDNWSLAGEAILPGQKDRAQRLKKYMELQRMVADNVREENPEALMRSPSTCDLYPGNGIAQIEEMWQNGAGDIFDICEAHSYRPRPEVPDLDNDISVLLKMLDKYNFKGQVWFAEDLNYTCYNIPAYGLDTAEFADFWKGALSYDIGMGERLQAAYNARMWLIALKYYPRVGRLYWHNYFSSIIDLNGCSRLACWAPNILGHIFGEGCVYLSDLVFSDDVRCYLFKDGKNRPVAAIWNINEEIDREKRPPLTAKLPFSSSEVEIIDFVGNRIDFKPGDTLKIYPTPTFLRGKHSSGFFAATRDKITGFIKSVILRQERESFAAMLGKLEVQGGQKHLVKMTTEILDRQNVAVKVKNLTSSVISGTLAIHSGGDARENLNLPVAGEKTVAVKLPELNDHAVNKVPLQINFTGPDGKSQSNEASFKMLLCNKAAKPPTIDGDLADWPAGSGVKLDGLLKDYTVPPALQAQYPQPQKWNGPEDLSATLYTAWGKEYFYLALDITDDVFCPTKPGVAYIWEYDSVQIYFDTAFDARNLNSKGYDSTDYCYNACYRGGKMEVTRNQVPDWQLCFFKTGPAPEVKAAFKKTYKGYIYEFAFPASELVPMRLEKNRAIGFAVLINENDNDYHKRGISLTAPGREPYQNPTAWPAMLLVE